MDKPTVALDDVITSVKWVLDKLINGCGSRDCCIKHFPIGTNSLCKCRPQSIAHNLNVLADILRAHENSYIITPKKEEVKS